VKNTTPQGKQTSASTIAETKNLTSPHPLSVSPPPARSAQQQQHLQPVPHKQFTITTLEEEGVPTITSTAPVATPLAVKPSKTGKVLQLGQNDVHNVSRSSSRVFSAKTGSQIHVKEGEKEQQQKQEWLIEEDADGNEWLIEEDTDDEDENGQASDCCSSVGNMPAAGGLMVEAGAPPSSVQHEYLDPFGSFNAEKETHLVAPEVPLVSHTRVETETKCTAPQEARTPVVGGTLGSLLDAYNMYGFEPDPLLPDDENLMRATLLVTRNSICMSGYMGCILVNPKNLAGNNCSSKTLTESIVGVATNRPLYTNLESDVHAEIGALGQAARLGNATEGCTAYITMPPCKTCFGALQAAGIRRIVTRRTGNKVITKAACRNGKSC
jgi:deoxycytidylate deaminase